MVNAAQGEASRFTAVAAEYVKAPDVTRKRLYLETMEGVLGNVQMFLSTRRRGRPTASCPTCRSTSSPDAGADGQTERPSDAPPSRPHRAARRRGLPAPNSIFTVDERQKAMVLQFGQVRAVKEKPGLAFKIPFIQNVVFYDSRIQGLDTTRWRSRRSTTGG